MILEDITTRGKKGHNDRPGSSSPPLIWRAVKHLTDKNEHVWSAIPGLEGAWSIRYSPMQLTNLDVNTFKYFYIWVKNRHSKTWTEILPTDDEHLEIRPDGKGGWEVTADEFFDSKNSFDSKSK
ncbi:MAG: hypothetical protein DDT31_00638 [Syntrophomonadaceae bacterium]|nr:hypothetical protein [Bacillota bacterium]